MCNQEIGTPASMTHLRIFGCQKAKAVQEEFLFYFVLNIRLKVTMGLRLQLS